MKIPEKLLLKFLQNNFEVKQTSSNEVRINSPFQDDRKFHVYINPETSVYTDFKEKNSDDSSGSMEKFIARFLGINRNQVIPTLIKDYGLSFGDFNITKSDFLVKEDDGSKEVIKDFLDNEEGLVFFNETEKIGTFGKKVLEYLRARKISERYISDMGYIFDENSEYDKRVIVPFFEENCLVYFVARDTTNKSKLRYKNPPKLDTKEYVLNIDNINDELVICEGSFDALSLNEGQIGTAMCSGDLGTKQIMKIVNKAPSKIIYVPDQDATGMAKMDKNITNLFYCYPPSLNLDVYIYNVPYPFKDLNELKVNTGKDFISYSECEKYNKLKIKPMTMNKKRMDF